MKRIEILWMVSLLVIICPTRSWSQKSVVTFDDQRWLEIGGWVRTDFIYNSRATEEAVDGLYSLYPLNVAFDADGNDINGNPSVAMSSATTRFTTTFHGPNVGKAFSTAYVEVDLSAKSTTNSFHFRQGWIKLNWDKLELMIGRAWHPLSTYSMPHVINISFGAPFFVFNRSEQLRFTYNPGNMLLSATASYHGQYASNGPLGKSASYMRNAIIPEMSIAAQWSKESFKVGAVGSTKTIQPRTTISGTDGFIRSTDEKLTTFSAQLFSAYETSSLSLRVNATYTQNMYDGSMLGGYAVSALDEATGYEQYTPTQHANAWVSLEMGDKLRYGFFAGHSVNMGMLAPVEGPTYGRGLDIKSISRLSPRVYYTFPKFKFGCELELTRAWYGTPDNADRGKVKMVSPVNNTRLLLYAQYSF